MPTLADVCLIDVITDDGRRSDGSRSAGPGSSASRSGLTPFPPGYDDESHPIIRVMRTGEPLFVEEITPEFLDSITRLQQHRRLAAALHPRSTIIVPLKGVDRIYGAIVLINTAMSNRTFARDDFASRRGDRPARRDGGRQRPQLPRRARSPRGRRRRPRPPHPARRRQPHPRVVTGRRHDASSTSRPHVPGWRTSASSTSSTTTARSVAS